MKYFATLAIIVSVQLNSIAQNVGIGTTSPQKPLHVQGSGELLRLQGFSPWLGFMNNSDVTYRGFIFYPDTSLVMGSISGSNMRLIIAPNNIALLHATSDQRIGIGTSAPTEKLDVDGNINLTGTVKANGADGTAGQVLMKNSTGNLAWGDMCEFKNYASFTSGTDTWVVPAGVTRVRVEAWGGGGGGNFHSGGGGGGYITAILTVTPGNSISCEAGTGGVGGSTLAISGTQSTVTYSSYTFNALGGGGATYTPPLIGGANGGGYSASVPVGFNSYIGVRGEAGQGLQVNTFQSSATTFFEISTGGKGGNAGNTDNTGGQGSYYLFNITAATELRVKNGEAGQQPGGGGGSGYIGTTIFLGNSDGKVGGAGMIVIHY